jgi:hypothetical protein
MKNSQRPALRNELGFLSDADVANVLGIELQTLKNRRAHGDVPASSKVGAEHLTTIENLRLYVARKSKRRTRAIP